MFKNPGASSGGYPLIVFINHNKEIKNIMGVSPSKSTMDLWINSMLDVMPQMSTSIQETKLVNFKINRLYPNPFNPTLRMNIDIQRSEIVNINIFDINGIIIEELYSGFLQTGNYDLRWDTKLISSGVYFVSLKSQTQSITKKVALLK